ncbi:MAG: hypothetical protein QM764_02175 [Chitinophagaceae bacterium]
MKLIVYGLQGYLFAGKKNRRFNPGFSIAIVNPFCGIGYCKATIGLIKIINETNHYET